MGAEAAVRVGEKELATKILTVLIGSTRYLSVMFISTSKLFVNSMNWIQVMSIENYSEIRVRDKRRVGDREKSYSLIYRH